MYLLSPPADFSWCAGIVLSLAARRLHIISDHGLKTVTLHICPVRRVVNGGAKNALRMTRPALFPVMSVDTCVHSFAGFADVNDVPLTVSSPIKDGIHTLHVLDFRQACKGALKGISGDTDCLRSNVHMKALYDGLPSLSSHQVIKTVEKSKELLIIPRQLRYI